VLSTILGADILINISSVFFIIMANQTQGERLSAMAVSIDNIEKDIDEIKKKLDADYITQDKHALLEDKVARLEKLVYGMVSIILIAVIGAVVSLVLG